MTIHLGDPARHFFMTRSVARVMGLDLHAALHGGTLSPETYAGMVTACRGCALVEACESWLSQQSQISDTPPPGCCNTDTYCRLRKAH